MTDHTKDGLLLLSYSTEEGTELNCWFEYEAAERGARSRFGEQLEPDYPATWALWHAYLPDSNVDLCPLMRVDLIEEIEGWAVYQAEEEAADREWDDGYDKFQDWKDAQ
jgi:hypothetical protein